MATVPIEPPRPRYGRRLRLLTGDDDAVLQDQEERKRPLDIVNSQGGAVWIGKSAPASSARLGALVSRDSLTHTLNGPP